jgi:Arc/MetJ family transcription regulator
MMTMTMDVDEKLLNSAEKKSGLPSKDAVVNAALKEYVRIKDLQQFFDLRGTVDDAAVWDGQNEREQV